MKKRKTYLYIMALFFVFTLQFFCLNRITAQAASGKKWYKIVSNKSISLKYDDRYSFAKSSEGYAVVGVINEKVSSYQVKKGKVTRKKDKHVVMKQSSNTSIVATGTGSADVLLVPKAKYASVKKQMKHKDKIKTPISMIKVHVTVKKAPLAVFFLTGQSNMEGSLGAGVTSKAADSIACVPGTTYATFGFRTPVRTKQEIGVASNAIFEGNNVNDFVQESLTSSKSLKNKIMPFRSNALGSSGKGKTGPDAGIAYEWYRLTGEKVWTINTSYGASYIQEWQSNGSKFNRSMKMNKACIKLLTAEVKAGHFIQKRRVMFWLQGEADNTMDAWSYKNYFMSMYNSFKSQLKLNAFAMISVRAAVSKSRTPDDIIMTGPRITQYLLANDRKYSKILMCSNVNEQWVTDENVKNYFAEKYPSGRLSYKMHKGATTSLVPKTVMQVHPDVHFTQLAHNENGLTAARNLYKYLYNKDSIHSVTFKNAKCVTVKNINMNVSGSCTLIAYAEPVVYGKNMSLKMDSNMLSYNYETGRLTAKRSGTTTISAVNRSGKVIGSVKVTIK